MIRWYWLQSPILAVVWIALAHYITLYGLSYGLSHRHSLFCNWLISQPYQWSSMWLVRRHRCSEPSSRQCYLHFSLERTLLIAVDRLMLWTNMPINTSGVSASEALTWWKIQLQFVMAAHILVSIPTEHAWWLVKYSLTMNEEMKWRRWQWQLWMIASYYLRWDGDLPKKKFLCIFVYNLI